jgi:hypothetical protein
VADFITRGVQTGTDAPTVISGSNE